MGGPAGGHGLRPRCGAAVDPRGGPARAGAQQDGRRRLTLTFERLSEARTALLGLGDPVEALGPEELRAGIAATGRALAEIYARP